MIFDRVKYREALQALAKLFTLVEEEKRSPIDRFGSILKSLFEVQASEAESASQLENFFVFRRRHRVWILCQK